MKLRSALMTVPAAAVLTFGGLTAAHAVEPAAAGPAGQQRVYDPSTLIAVPNGRGLLAPDGTNICDVPDPLNVVDAEGTNICFTGVVAGPGTTGSQTPGGPVWLPPHTGVVVGPETAGLPPHTGVVAGPGTADASQIARMPVGGVDTGVGAESSSATEQLVPGLSVAAVLTLAGIALLGVYRRSLR